MSTDNERLANKMDRDVYRLAEWAEREAERQGVNTERGRRWREAERHLRSADTLLWSLMSSTDRARINAAALDGDA